MIFLYIKYVPFISMSYILFAKSVNYTHTVWLFFFFGGGEGGCFACFFN